MPTVHDQNGTYKWNWLAVSAMLWDKYDDHPYVTDVEVVSRSVDESGRLHSRRLLTMKGKLPATLRPLLGGRPLYIQEDVIVDPKGETVSVHTRTLNFASVIDSRSRTHYFPSSTNKDHTNYTIEGKEASSQNSDAAFESTASGRSWGMGLGRAVEEFTTKKLLGNVKQGEDTMNAFLERFRRNCRANSNSPWLCSKVL